MTESCGKAREIDLGEDFDVVVKVNGVRLEIRSDGSVDAYTNGAVYLRPAANDDTRAKATHEIGDIETDGAHKGEIYGGMWSNEYGGDNKPIWISEEPEPMTHYDAVELKGRALPTSKQGNYINSIKDKGALKDIFARHSDGSSSAGYFWLAEPNNHYYFLARDQQFSLGSQNYSERVSHQSVLSVRR